MDAITAGFLFGLQTLVTLSVDGEGPVRLGVPLPARTLTRGLHVEGEPGAVLQWAPLQEQPGCDSERIWVELCVCGGHGTVRIAAGGDGPTHGSGPACRVEASESGSDLTHESHRTRTWADGTVDRYERMQWLVGDPELGIHSGEASTSVGAAWIERRTRVRVAPDFWRAAGVLPRARAPGEAALRHELLELLPRLPAAPGERGRGDYVRGDERHGPVTVTNLEFDTTLGLVRLGLVTGDRGALSRAWRSARHLVDRDRDPRSGLPCRHGRDHRSARPELGHVWIRGLLLVGCTFAERDLLDAARSIARSLATRVRGEPPKEGIRDRMRDEAWPLWELEEYLRFEDVEPVRQSASALAERMMERFDATLGVLRYGEGETRGASVKDRVWLSVGIAAPALRRYAERTGDRQAERIAATLERRAVELLRAGRGGVPLQCMVSSHGTFGEARVRGCPEGYLLLDGLSEHAQRSLIPRVRGALDGALDVDADDLATRWTMVARCAWVLR